MTESVPELLVTGAAGQLGSTLCEMSVRAELPTSADGAPLGVWGTVTPGGARPAGVDVIEVDLREPDALIERVVRRPPVAIVHLAAVSRVDMAYRDPLLAHEVNVDATAQLAHLAMRVGARFILASTDMVFDGGSAPYAESDAPHPLTTYGRTKLAAEAHVLSHPGAVVARLPLLFGIPPLRPERSHLWRLAELRGGATSARLFHDEYRSPMSLRDAARCLCRLASSPNVSGVVHLSGGERLSRAQLGRRWATRLAGGFPIETVSCRSHEADEPRPEDLTLQAARYERHFGEPPAPSLDVALDQCAADLRALQPGH